MKKLRAAVEPKEKMENWERFEWRTAVVGVVATQ